MADYEILIVGGGIAGASLASELAGKRNVLLLEREPLNGTHATGRSAALYIHPYGGPAMSMLAKASLPFLAAPPSDFALSLLTPRPLVWLARSDQAEAFERLSADFRAAGSELTDISPEDAAARWPFLDPAYLKDGRLTLDDGCFDIDVHALHSAFLSRFRQAGGTSLTNAEALSFTREGRVWTVRTPAGEFTADIIVNAAGAWADEVASRTGRPPLGLRVTRRTMVLTSPLEISLPDLPCFVDVSEEFYFKPEGDGLLISPADETRTEPGDAQPEELDVAIAIDRFERATTLEVPSIRQKWAGLRTFAADHEPIMGWDPSAPGLFWLAGQGGAGIMTSPALARLAASLILGDAIPDDLAVAGIRPDDLSPSRFR